MRTIPIDRAKHTIIPALKNYFKIPVKNIEDPSLITSIKLEVLKLKPINKRQYDVFSALISACQGVGISLAELSGIKKRIDIDSILLANIKEAINELIFENIPEYYLDSITHDIFLAPTTVLPTGRTYCLSALIELYQPNTLIQDPLDRTKLYFSNSIIFNFDLYRQIQAWCETYNMLDFWKKNKEMQTFQIKKKCYKPCRIGKH